VQTLTNALDKLSQVRLVSYRYTDEYRAQHPSLEDRAYANVVAQEFQEVFPDYVKAGSDTLADGSEILQVDTSPLIVYSAAAVQELSQQVKARDARIAELERRLEKLEQLVNSVVAR
jgi:hypothetical protein